MQTYDNLLVILRANVTPQLAEDVQSLIDKLEQEKKDYRNQLLDTRHLLQQKDYTVENQRNVIDNTNKTLKRYIDENEALRVLVRLWS